MAQIVSQLWGASYSSLHTYGSFATGAEPGLTLGVVGTSSQDGRSRSYFGEQRAFISWHSTRSLFVCPAPVVLLCFLCSVRLIAYDPLDGKCCLEILPERPQSFAVNETISKQRMQSRDRTHSPHLHT